MEHFALQAITNNPHIWRIAAYYIVFFSGLLEPVPVFGILVPGQTMVVIAGFFARQKIFSFYSMFLWTASGAIVGDILAFYLGKKFGLAILRKHGGKFFVKEKHIEATRELVTANPGKTLFIGRFNSITRSLAPFVAGASGINTRLFLMYCFFGCIAWAFLFLSIGFIFGKSFEIIAPAVGAFIFIATAIVILTVLLLNFLKRKGFNLSNRDIHLVIVNIASLYVFSSFCQALVRDSRLLYAFDNRIFLFIPKIRSVWLDFAMISLSKIRIWHFVAFAFIISLILYLKKRRDEAGAVFLGLITSTIIVSSLKIFFGRERPLASLIDESGGSFPSGHAVFSAFFIMLVIYFAMERVKGRAKRAYFVAFGTLLIVIVGFSRVYLGVHYISDVIAGIALGGFLFSATFLILRILPWLTKKLLRKEIIPNL